MNTRKGFTLVELLVVIAILAILATVSVVGYTSFIDRAEESNALTEAAQIKKGIEASLLVDEEVKVGDAYITKSGTTYVVGTDDATKDHDDLSEDVPPAGAVTVETISGAKVLVYTNSKTGVRVDVLNAKVLPAAPAAGE